jgi:hypothetical protein
LLGCREARVRDLVTTIRIMVAVAPPSGDGGDRELSLRARLAVPAALLAFMGLLALWGSGPAARRRAGCSSTAGGDCGPSSLVPATWASNRRGGGSSDEGSSSGGDRAPLSPSPSPAAAAAEPASPSAAASPSPAAASPSPPHHHARPRCGDTPYPWPAGSFDASTPPFWRPDPVAQPGCDVRAFDGDNVETCLANRTVFVMGNSVGRGYFFELPAMLTHTAAPDRGWQKEECTKVPGDAGDMWLGVSCANEVPSLGMHGDFLWWQWFWTPPPFVGHDHLFADNCADAGSPGACYARFLENATERDYLVFSSGLILSEQYSKLAPLGFWYNVSADGANVSWPWLEESVTRFAAALTAPGLTRIPVRHMLYATTTEVIGGDNVNAVTHVLNRVVVPILQAAGIGIVDQRTINEGHANLYGENDATHFPGVLSQAFWHVALSQLCAEDPDVRRRLARQWGSGGGGSARILRPADGGGR